MKFNEEHKEEIYKRAEILKALSNPVRLCLLIKLIQDGPASVNEITSCMDVSQSAISQHLSKLRDMNIVKSTKVENRIFYSCEREDVKRIISCLMEDIK
ncbi:ArsR/SmtB family transcription factor [Peptoniphilus sp.]|uniref:ArsR/SmtB family transcription factor n=1 Tax=Peptoniphilus sp. TaxID=1971214 RepID=UPI003D8AD7B6